jgi:hypothetical protein
LLAQKHQDVEVVWMMLADDKLNRPNATRHRLDHSAIRFGALAAVWICSGLIYYAIFVGPYGLADRIATPQYSFAAEANREAGIAARFAGGFLLLFALYAVAYRICRNWQSRRAIAFVLIGGAGLALLLMPAYPIGANDVFEYLSQGELLARFGLNPMVHTLSEVPDLTWPRHIIWLDYVSYYGPIWSWIEAGIVKVVGTVDLVRLVMAFKLVAVMAYLAICSLIVRVLKDRSPRQVLTGLLIFAWNPLVLFEVAVNAHNDVLVGLFIVAGVWFWQQQRLLAMFAMLTLAPLIKAPAAVVLPLFMMAAWRSQPADGRRRLIVRGSSVIAAVAAGAYLSLPEGLAGLTNLPRLGGLYTDSVATLIKLSVQLIAPEAIAAGAALVICLGVLGRYTIRQLRAINQTPDQVVVRAFNTLLLLLLFSIPWFQPWYWLWVLPLAAIYPRPNAPYQAALSTVCVTWTYVVYGFVWFWLYPIGNWGNSLVIQVVAVLTTYGLPWIYALRFALTRRPKPMKALRPA